MRYSRRLEVAMAVEDGTWIMKGVEWDNPECIHTIEELEKYIEEVGFLPLFANGVEGFSVEEWTDPHCWWCDDERVDPWRWRETIARRGKIAYGKFFDKKAGFISLEWLPYFVNARRDGYDFDSAWEDGRVSRREKVIMDLLTDKDEDGDIIFTDKNRILSTNLKKMAGFGKGGLKNYQGITTGLMMKLYLVIVDFRRRVSKKGEEYGMPVSIMLPPEAVWGYETVTSAYEEKPEESRRRIFDHVKLMYEEAADKDISRLIG